MLVREQYIKVLFWLLAIAVFILSAVPGSGVQSIAHLDKLAHFIAFFLLSILFLFAYKLSRPFFTTVFCMTLFGLIIELLHIYMPQRVFSVYDFVADVVGILVAFAVYKFFNFRVKPI